MMSKTAENKTTLNIYEQATNRIIALLEKGEVAWRRTWGTYGLARNYKTGHVYSGINLFFLNFMPTHPIPYYLTFKQIKSMGGKLRKGSKAERVYFYKGYYKDEHGNNISEADSDLAVHRNKTLRPVRFLKSYPVFNIEDTENIEWERPIFSERENNPIEECEVILNEMSEQPIFERTDSNAAFYDPVSDVINVPDIRQFETAEFFYRTTFHELAHWTGNEQRLSRPGIIERIDRNSDRYAEEELIAELTSNYLCSIAGVNNDAVMDVSAGYLKAWIERLKADPKIIFRVAPKAQKAAEYILGEELENLQLTQKELVLVN